MIIGIDVDRTICDVCADWAKYIVRALHITEDDIPEFLCDFYNTPEYNLSKWLKTQGWMEGDEDVQKIQSFWDQPHIYDDASLFPGVFEAIYDWVNHGHQVIFISHCKAGHKAGKLRKMKEWFRDNKTSQIPFIDTKYKQFINVDVMIDDCPDVHVNMKKVKAFCLCIYKMGDMPRLIAPEWADFSLSNWGDIKNVVNNHRL